MDSLFHFKIPKIPEPAQNLPHPEHDIWNLPKFNYVDVRKLEIVGGGSFGDVYKGLYDGSPVAVKKLKGVGENAAKRMVKEARIIKRCQENPQIVSLLGVCCHPLASMLPYEVFTFKPFGGKSLVEVNSLDIFLEFVNIFRMNEMEHFIPTRAEQIKWNKAHHKLGKYLTFSFS